MQPLDMNITIHNLPYQLIPPLMLSERTLTFEGKPIIDAVRERKIWVNNDGFIIWSPQHKLTKLEFNWQLLKTADEAFCKVEYVAKDDILLKIISSTNNTVALYSWRQNRYQWFLPERDVCVNEEYFWSFLTTCQVIEKQFVLDLFFMRHKGWHVRLKLDFELKQEMSEMAIHAAVNKSSIRPLIDKFLETL